MIDMDYYSKIKSGYISVKKIFTALESHLSSTFKNLPAPISIFELEWVDYGSEYQEKIQDEISIKRGYS